MIKNAPSPSRVCMTNVTEGTRGTMYRYFFRTLRMYVCYYCVGRHMLGGVQSVEEIPRTFFSASYFFFLSVRKDDIIGVANQR